MADDMGKIDKTEPCIIILGCAAGDSVSKSVPEFTTRRQSLNHSVN